MNIRMIRKMFVGKELVEDNIMKVDTVVNYDKRNDRGIIIIRFQGADKVTRNKKQRIPH